MDNLALALTVSLWAGMAIFTLRIGSDVLALVGVAKRFPARPSYVLPWLTVNLAGIVVQSLAAFAGAAASFTLMSGGITAGKFTYTKECVFLAVIALNVLKGGWLCNAICIAIHLSYEYQVKTWTYKKEK